MAYVRRMQPALVLVDAQGWRPGDVLASDRWKSHRSIVKVDRVLGRVTLRDVAESTTEATVASLPGDVRLAVQERGAA